MLAIDHLVIAAKDPRKAANDFGEKYNMRTIQGGKHENWGTYNYLAYLANDCYIEWIGIFDEDLAQKSANPLIQQLVHALKEGQEGLFQIAFRTKNIDQFTNHFKSENIAYKGPIEGNRAKPDGTTLEWKMLFPHPNKSEFLYPFLIEWGKEENRPDDERDINKQSLGSIRIPKKVINKFLFVFQFTGFSGLENGIKLSNSTIYFSQVDQLQFKVR